MLRKAFDDVAHTDITDLVANKIMESRTLEYKRDLPGGSDREKKEFLADISSFANAQGGDLIYGVSEQTGWASELVGVASDDPDAMLLKMEALILSSVEPRIPGVRLRWIEGPPDALIIRVPASPVAPHRITYQNSGRFYGRKSNGKYEMDSYELRDAFVAADALPTRLRRLHFDAVEAADGGPLPVSLGDEPRAIASIMPLNFFRESRELPVTPENALMPIKPSGRAEFIHMVEGVMFLTNPGVSGDVRSYALTHRTGRTDIAWTIGRLFNELTRNELRMVWSVSFEEGLTDAVLSSVQRLQNFGIEGPWAVFVSLLGTKGYQLNQNDRIVSEPAWRDRLTLPDLVADRLDAEALLPLFRSFWLCFGVPRPDGPQGI